METSSGPEHDPDPSIDRLPAAWGFAETAELAAQRADAIAGLAEGHIEPALAYRMEAERVFGGMQGDAAQRAEIGMHVVIATLRRDAGLTEAYLDDLWDAYTYAHQRGYDDIADAIRTEMARYPEE